MNELKTSSNDDERELLHRAATGDQQALRAVFSRHRERLKDADCEVTLARDGLPMADSVSLAAQLLGKLSQRRGLSFVRGR